MTRVIVLRPEPGASATVNRARVLGLDAIAVPLFAIEPIDWAVPEVADFDGLLLTSANAVRQAGAGLQALRTLPVYAVGRATADAARSAGFAIAATGEADAAALLDSIPAELRLLHLCGEDRKAFAGPRQSITSLVVYRARPLDAPALGLVGGGVALVHSPRAGRRLAELVTHRAAMVVAALSPAAAAAVGTGWAGVSAAERPTDDALLALAARLCNKPQP